MAFGLDCPVCFTIPEGEVHQCNEGHCYCVTCWRALNPRQCPECRQPIQDSCRNRDREARITAFKATCEHCAEVMTRGSMTTHLRTCPQRPTAFAGAAAGCGWSGAAANQTACPVAMCLRIMAPLQACCDGLQSQNQQLQVQNEQLQQQMAALQLLAGPIRALEGDGREEQAAAAATRGCHAADTDAGERPQRQRVGATLHTAQPSNAVVQRMGATAAVAALQTHVAVARIAKEACGRIATLCIQERNRQPAAEAGALEAVVAAMKAHPHVVGVQVHGCGAMRNMCGGGNAAAL